MYDLSRLYVRIDECPADTKLCDHFDELKCFSEFLETDNENIIKAAILTADMESPFLKIKDRKTMIKAVFDFVGLDVSKQETNQLYNSIVDYKDPNYLNCFGRYLMIYHDIDWTEYQSTKQTHDVLTMDSMRPMEKDEDLAKFVDRKDKVRKMLKATGEELRKLEAKIFPDGKAAREIALNENKKIKTYAERYSQDNSYI